MSSLSNFTAYRRRDLSVCAENGGYVVGSRAMAKTLKPFEKCRLNSLQFPSPCLRKVVNGPNIQMALVNERFTRGREIIQPSEILTYDLVQGASVRWSYIMDKSTPDPPTAILLHGILGCRKNWGTFAKRLAQEFPKWQFLLVDLRCHGGSASIMKRAPHTVTAAACDVLKLLGKLRLSPRVVIGHSFGGKVALSMVEQVAKPLARPVRVWVLDATPGKVRGGGVGDDRPAELISFLRTLPPEEGLF